MIRTLHFRWFFVCISIMAAAACASSVSISVVAPGIDAAQSGRLFVVFSKADEKKVRLFSREVTTISPDFKSVGPLPDQPLHHFSQWMWKTGMVKQCNLTPLGPIR